MPIILQVILVIFCIVLLTVIVRQISKSRVIFSDFNYWIIFVLFLLIIALFPSLVEFIARVVGIQTPVVAVFLMVIFLLILLVLSSAFRISVLNRRTIQLTQKVALMEETLEKRLKEDEVELANIHTKTKAKDKKKK